MFYKFLYLTATAFCLSMALSHEALAAPNTNWAPDYNIGDQFPNVSRPDQSGNATSLLPEQQTHLILLSRSVVW